MPKQTNRKNEHVSLSENFYKEGISSFNDVHFVHHSFPEINVADIDTSVSLVSYNLMHPSLSMP